MGNIGWTKINEFKGIGFKHETKEFLVRFSFQDNGFPIEAIVQQDFIRWQSVDTGVTKNEPIVHVADVTNEEMVILKNGFEVRGPDLFTDGDHHQAECRR